MTELSGDHSLFQWLETSAPAIFIRQSTWLYPSVEIIHIVSFVVLAGSAILFDLRLLGWARKLSVTEALRLFTFWAMISFFAVLLSGSTLFMVDATSLASNTAFRIKLILIAIAGLNAICFHLFTRKTVDSWDVDIIPPLSARTAGIVSIVLWISVIACGRLIAYL